MDINIDVTQPEAGLPIELDISTGVSYPTLDKKPQINGIVLVGNKTSEDLGLQPQGDYALKSDIVSTDKFATKTELNSKQDKLVAGNNITIVNNVISATGGSGGGGAIDAYTKAETNTLLNSKQDKGNYALKSEIPVNTSDLFNDSGYITLNDIPNIDIEGAVTDVKVNGTSILKNGIANIPAAGADYGVVKLNSNYGIEIANGYIATISAADTVIDAKLNGRQVITPKNLDYAVKSSITTNSIELTEDEKSSVQNWIGTIKDVQANGTSVLADGVANIPIATKDQAGLVRPVPANGISVSSTGTLNLSKLSDASLVNKNSNYAVLVSQIDLATKIGVTTNTIELTDEEKANACNWLGATRIGTGSGTGEGGQSPSWIFSNTILMNTRTVIESTLEFDLSDYLPNDGLTYLIYGNARAEVKEGTENNFNIFAYSDLIPETTLVEICSKYNTSSSWGDRATGSFLIPIGAERKLGLYNSGSKTSKMVWLRVIMYQQIDFVRS